MEKARIIYNVIKLPDDTNRHVIQVMSTVMGSFQERLRPVVINLCMRDWWQAYFREYCNTSISSEFLEGVANRGKQWAPTAVAPLYLHEGSGEDYPPQLMLSGMVIFPGIPDTPGLDMFAADAKNSRINKYTQDSLPNWFDFFVTTYEFLHLETTHYGRLEKGMTSRFRNILTRNSQKSQYAA